MSAFWDVFELYSEKNSTKINLEAYQNYIVLKEQVCCVFPFKDLFFSFKEEFNFYFPQRELKSQTYPSLSSCISFKILSGLFVVCAVENV